MIQARRFIYRQGKEVKKELMFYLLSRQGDLKEMDILFIVKASRFKRMDCDEGLMILDYDALHFVVLCRKNYWVF